MAEKRGYMSLLQEETNDCRRRRSKERSVQLSEGAGALASSAVPLGG